MPRSKDLPFSEMQKISDSGIFVKRFDHFGKTPMKPYAHRDDYYMFGILTQGSAAIEIDFERIELKSGNILIVSPWQVHNKPAGEVWEADGWLLAFSAEMLSESEAGAIEEYSISPHPLNPGENILGDIVTLCSMLERYKESVNVSNALAVTVKNMVLSTLVAGDKDVVCRFRAITLKLSKLLDSHIAGEKSPSAYASMLNISEVYLNEAVKESVGLNVGAYIRARVILQAKRQLAYTSLSAKEIAYSLGYEDYAYFSKLFRKNVGKSPSDYRKNLK